MSLPAHLLWFQCNFDSIWVFSNGYGWFQTSWSWLYLDSDWLWVVTGSSRCFWRIADGFGWLWMILYGFKWFQMVSYFSSFDMFVLFFQNSMKYKCSCSIHCFLFLESSKRELQLRLHTYFSTCCLYFSTYCTNWLL